MCLSEVNLSSTENPSYSFVNGLNNSYASQSILYDRAPKPPPSAPSFETSTATLAASQYSVFNNLSIATSIDPSAYPQYIALPAYQEYVDPSMLLDLTPSFYPRYLGNSNDG